MVTGKAVTLPCFTTGNVVTESMSDSKAVQRTLKNLTRIVAEFRKANMRRKLKEYQGVQVQSYQHLYNYIDGDLVCYQPLNRNSWLGPVAVLCKQGQSAWVHTIGDINKVAMCRVKPFQLIDRESIKDSNSRKVMLGDGLENVKNLLD